MSCKDEYRALGYFEGSDAAYIYYKSLPFKANSNYKEGFSQVFMYFDSHIKDLVYLIT
jgi:hypothetical protein